ncbi:hypothetical protein [Streptomyces anulatus]|uniref:hypothetical protein n=1 Tax=Streptomyces anulatus TaxID=1892 RepID=UPI002254F2F3|nr:hypothetical protein [Streptomyces anulatus]MCX4503474.1 hypothetical protein [Streptomyces anulatus]
MAWDEWEQIKVDVADQKSTAMQINHLPVEPGPSASAVTGGLKTNQKAWLTAGEGIGSLRKGAGTALTKLEDGQTGLGSETGCLSAAAQREVYASWKRYVENVSKRCGSLQGILGQVGHDQLKTDEAVKAEMKMLRLRYADTDATGGQAKGR